MLCSELDKLFGHHASKKETTIYEFKTDHRSYKQNLSSCEIKAWKKIQAWTGEVTSSQMAW